MKRSEALEIVTRAAKAVEGIQVGPRSPSSPRQGPIMRVAGGRFITVEACRPTNKYRFIQRKDAMSDDPEINRVVIRAGGHGVGWRQSKEVTRTFRVLLSGGLNEAGIKRALREMAASQVQDEERKARNAKHKEERAVTKKAVMRKVDSMIDGGLRRSSDGREILECGMMTMAGFMAQIYVDDLSTVKVEFRLTVEEFEQLLEKLR